MLKLKERGATAANQGYHLSCATSKSEFDVSSFFQVVTPASHLSPPTFLMY